jgi:hypothetical protein
VTSRTKWVIGSAITVVVLVAVIFVGWNLSSPSKPPAPTVTAIPSPAQQSQDAYQQGVAALSSDQTATAAALFNKALTLNPNNSAAKKALDSMTSTKKTSTPVSNPATTKPAAKPKATDPFLTKVADIGELLPKSFSDYSLGARQKLGGDASVTGNPNAASAAASNITWAVHDRKSSAGAKAFVAKTTKKLYAKNAATVTIAKHSGYFGTDGTHFASAVVARGRYVFEVTLTSKSGPPSALKALALQAAGAFPSAP